MSQQPSSAHGETAFAEHEPGAALPIATLAPPIERHRAEPSDLDLVVQFLGKAENHRALTVRPSFCSWVGLRATRTVFAWSEAFAPNDWLRRILRVIGVRHGQLAEQEP